MNENTVSEYPLFLLKGNYKILDRWDATFSGESTWRVGQIISTGEIFVMSGLGTMEERYCIEEAVRLKKMPERIRAKIVQYIDEENRKDIHPTITVSSITRTVRESGLPF